MSGTANWSVCYNNDSGHLLVIAAVLALALSWDFASPAAFRFPQTPTSAAQIQPIDVEAFRNLIDPAEDEFLRRRCRRGLPPGAAARLRAMAAYVQVAGRNAAVLIGSDKLRCTRAMPIPREAARRTGRQCAAASPQCFLRAVQNLCRVGLADSGSAAIQSSTATNN